MSTLKLENIKHENSSTNNMVMDSDGNVSITNKMGIGTSTPDYDLTIEGSGHPRVRINSTDNTASGVFMHVSNGGSQTGTATVRVDGSGNYSVYNGTSSSPLTMNIDGSGRLSIPNQPQFCLQGNYNAWTTINQSTQWLPLTGSAGVATSTNNEIAMAWTGSRPGGYDPTGSGMNKSNGIFTAPITGTYMFTLQAYILKGAAGGGYIHINSYINGSDQMDYTIYGYNGNASAYVTPEITKIIRMAVNDTFAFRLYTNVNDYKIFPHYTCLCGYLLG